MIKNFGPFFMPHSVVGEVLCEYWPQVYTRCKQTVTLPCRQHLYDTECTARSTHDAHWLQTKICTCIEIYNKTIPHCSYYCTLQDITFLHSSSCTSSICVHFSLFSCFLCCCTYHLEPTDGKHQGRVSHFIFLRESRFYGSGVLAKMWDAEMREFYDSHNLVELWDVYA